MEMFDGSYLDLFFADDRAFLGVLFMMLGITFILFVKD